MPELKFTALVLTEINPASETCCHIDDRLSGDGCKHLVRRFEGFGHFCFCGVFAQHIPQDHSCGLSRLPKCIELFGTSKGKGIPETTREINALLKIATSTDLTAEVKKEEIKKIVTEANANLAGVLRTLAQERDEKETYQHSLQTRIQEIANLKNLMDELIEASKAMFEAWKEWTKAENKYTEAVEVAERQKMKKDWEALENAREERETAMEKFAVAQNIVSVLIVRAKGFKT
jgi:hypothetical protein